MLKSRPFLASGVAVVILNAEYFGGILEENKGDIFYLRIFLILRDFYQN